MRTNSCLVNLVPLNFKAIGMAPQRVEGAIDCFLFSISGINGEWCCLFSYLLYLLEKMFSDFSEFSQLLHACLFPFHLYCSENKMFWWWWWQFRKKQRLMPILVEMYTIFGWKEDKVNDNLRWYQAKDSCLRGWSVPISRTARGMEYKTKWRVKLLA